MDVEPLVAVTAGDGVITKKVAVFWTGAGELVAVLVAIPGEADEMIFVLWLALGLAAGMGAAALIWGLGPPPASSTTAVPSLYISETPPPPLEYAWVDSMSGAKAQFGVPGGSASINEPGQRIARVPQARISTTSGSLKLHLGVGAVLYLGEYTAIEVGDQSPLVGANRKSVLSLESGSLLVIADEFQIEASREFRARILASAAGIAFSLLNFFECGVGARRSTRCPGPPPRRSSRCTVRRGRGGPPAGKHGPDG